MMPLVFLLKTSDQSSEYKIQITKTNQGDGKQVEDKHGRHCTPVCSSVSVVGSFLYKAADHRVSRRDPLQDLSAGKHGVIALPLTLFVTNLESEEEVMPPFLQVLHTTSPSDAFGEYFLFL